MIVAFAERLRAASVASTASVYVVPQLRLPKVKLVTLVEPAPEPLR
jgi:hypothetical protein